MNSMALTLTMLLSSVVSANAATASTGKLHGNFVSAAAGHISEGAFQVVNRGPELFLDFDSSFKVTPGPDLRIVLRNSTDNSMIIVDRLNATEGAQEYKLPFTVNDAPKFDRVAIYCLKYNVNFGIAVVED